MKINKILLLSILLITMGSSADLNDKDFDGVPDEIDQCQNTPFLNEVDKTGCTTTVLTLPFETEKESLTMTFGHGYSTNEDLIDREEQRNTRFKVSYYLNSWSYTLQTGYYSHDVHDGMLDTIVRVRKRIKLNSSFAVNFGGGLKLPTYDFDGNKMDGLLYTSLHYYPTPSLSLFVGYNFTYIGDDEVPTVIPETPESYDEDTYEGLQNKNKYYAGIGYFFTSDFYINILYSNEGSKFVSEHRIKSISSSLYYKINETWFATVYYKRQIDDDDLHDNLLFTLGYTLW